MKTTSAKTGETGDQCPAAVGWKDMAEEKEGKL